MINVRIFERPSTRVLIVAWREAGRCCYSEQRWERTNAFEAGICALSGEAIAPGQAVFKPVGIPVPLNQMARIAESSLRNIVQPDDALA